MTNKSGCFSFARLTSASEPRVSRDGATEMVAATMRLNSRLETGMLASQSLRMP